MQIPIDIEKSKAATRTYQVNQKHTLPQGYVVDLQKVEFTPSATRIFYDVEANKEREELFASEIKKAGWDYSEKAFIRGNITYNILDDKGKVLLTDEDTLPGRHFSGQDPFLPMNDKQPLTFQLTSLEYTRILNWEIPFNPAEVAKNNVEVKKEESVYTIKKIEHTSDFAAEVSKLKEKRKSEGSSIIKTGLENKESNLYQPSFHLTTSKNKDGKEVKHIVAVMQGPKEMPKQLSLVLPRGNVTVDKLDWRVPRTQANK
ncbi:DUF5643 domain-containing protein [Brevibacillus daliensis]|uniref:DUF5643 domain-containing protein n=1 Tax=Brevibacillus daliensis TaxID=2892995 RepID=UPI001E2C6FFB|nr:DUF5643 domain-containing protein [Brevibacillus daliensis]